MSQLNKKDWNEFIAKSPKGTFLQSWEWGEVQQEYGSQIWRLTTRTSSSLAGAILVVKRVLPSGQHWLYVPRGPIVRERQGEALIYDKLVSLAEEQRALFVRIEPAGIPGDDWRKADHDVQPRHTMIVDLERPEELLLESMHRKTRYNIRLAERKGVKVRFSRSEDSVEAFLRLAREVTERNHFHFHPDDYYRVLRRVGCRKGNDMKVEFALAEYEGEVLAVHVLVYFGDTVTYAHGASSSSKRQLMAPHLLQWESIKRAKMGGFRSYDLFGVSLPFTKAAGGKDVLHPWTGITRFKEGFSGKRVDYVGAYDRPFNKVGYWLYVSARRLVR